MKASLIGLVDYGENGSDCDGGGGGDYVDDDGVVMTEFRKTLVWSGEIIARG